jgi:hypothetical protein
MQEKKKIKLPSFLILIFLFTITTIGAYYYSEYKKDKGYISYAKFLGETFGNKSAISDYVNIPVKGKLNDDIFFSEDAAVEIFSESSGGWTIFSLEKEYSNLYKYEEFNSNGMGYKLPEFEIVEKTSQTFPYEKHLTREYNNRPSIADSYKSAFDKIFFDYKDNYESKSIKKMNKFENKISKFYNLEITEKGEGIRPRLSNKSTTIYYKSSFKTYEVKLLDDVYQQYLIINLLIAIGISLIIYLLWKFGKRITFAK